MTLSEILAQVAEYSPRFVTVTGGEPLAQRDCWLLLKMLCDAGYTTSVETSGAVDIRPGGQACFYSYGYQDAGLRRGRAQPL